MANERGIWGGEIRLDRLVRFARKRAISGGKFITGISANVKKLISGKCVKCAFRDFGCLVEPWRSFVMQKAAFNSPHECELLGHLLRLHFIDKRPKQVLLGRS